MSTALRPDGRAANELRPLTIVYEGLDRVDGSARFGFGETKALTSVSGPIEVRAALEQPSQATLDVHVRPLASLPGTDAKALAATLKALLTPALFLAHHPRSLVQLVAQAICSNGGRAGSWRSTLIAALINASCAALLNAASVPMRGVVCAVAVGRRGDTLLLDPAEEEFSDLLGSGCFAFLFSSSLPFSSDVPDVPPCSLLWTNYTTTTAFDEAELGRARNLAEQGARDVWGALKGSITSVDKSLVARSIVEKPRSELSEDKEEKVVSNTESEADDDKMEI